jgi:hypothetical protein
MGKKMGKKMGKNGQKWANFVFLVSTETEHNNCIKKHQSAS